MTSDVFALGASGHQDLGSEETQRFVAQSIRSVFLAAAQQHPNLVLYAALAVGADQLFIRTALDLQIPVEAVIPHEGYEAIYSSEKEREAYSHLLRQCRAVHFMGFPHQTDDAYLAAGQWIVQQSDLVILVWNGLAPQGRGGTGDVATYAWRSGRPFVQIDVRNQRIQHYHNRAERAVLSSFVPVPPQIQRTRRYQGKIFTLDEYQMHFPQGQHVVREIVERPASVLIVPVNAPGLLTVIEEYNLGARQWQLTLPGGKRQLPDTPADSADSLFAEAQRELREETGYRAGRFETLLAIASHPGYVAHRVHLVMATDLEWDPLPSSEWEDIRVYTYRLEDALAETLVDYRCDPEAALALWIYRHKEGGGSSQRAF